ncbi:MAG: UDP-3-O-acyl-N-acetylglucosamine deacetylase [Planctomycetota bacterium]|jgi:UDP-3-O-[3-hydroxymyristoyl] N-acetylglucosamine deacetylase/3-hydroxyacyl-[acyl-carrier-protein] dehydratase
MRSVWRQTGRRRLGGDFGKWNRTVRTQQTIAKSVEIEGKGLFAGSPTIVRMHPAEPGAGITFVRADQTDPTGIRARVENVAKRARRTSLRNGTVSVETVEHCLSACSGLGVDNLVIELVGEELPAGDGSGLPFVDKLTEAGVATQDANRNAFVISDTVRVADGDSELVALPPLTPDAQTLEIFYDLDYGPSGPIGRQTFTLVLSPETWVREIAPARTFVLEEEARQLLESGLGTHLTYADILVFGHDRPIENAQRFPDACVRHTILDLIGDLYLLGRPIVGRIHARKSGHALNHELVRAFVRRIRETERADLLTGPPKMDIRQIQRILPHRYPFLMVDRIVQIEGSKRAVGIKNVTVNEEWFQGHFPGQPIMPGVLIIEGMAQIGGILLSQELEHKGKVAVLLSLDKVKFRRQVAPGDQLVLIAEAIRVKPRTGHVKTTAMVGEELVAEAIIKFMLADAQAG